MLAEIQYLDYVFKSGRIVRDIVSWENLEGGQESSHHSGEIYRQRVRDYLESIRTSSE